VTSEHRKQLVRRSKEINAQLASPDNSTRENGASTIKSWGKPLDSFAYFTQDSTIEELKQELNLGSIDLIKEMQKFIRGESVSMLRVQQFCDAWKQANDKGNIDEGHSWYQGLDEFVKNLSTVSTRAEFLYSDCAPSEIRPEFDASKQRGRIIENPSSPEGWGAGGASLAIQNGLGPQFKAAQHAAYKPHVDEVGHAEVAASFVVHVTDEMKLDGRLGRNAPSAVISVRGTNRNAWYLLGGKVKLRALFKGKVASKRQEEKLRASHQAYFLGAKAYNRARVEAGLKPVYDLSLLPVSANIFGYPPEAAGKIMVEEAFRFMANNPDYNVRFLASGKIDESKPKSRALRDGISNATGAFGVGMRVSKGKDADAVDGKINLDRFTRDTANFLALEEKLYPDIKNIMTGKDEQGYKDFTTGNNPDKGVKLSGILRGLGAITKSVGNILSSDLMIAAAKENGSFRELKALGKLFNKNEEIIQWLGMGHCKVHGPLSSKEANRLIDFLDQAKQIVKKVIESRTWQESDFEPTLRGAVFADCQKEVRALIQYADQSTG
jgi:O-acetyl-ADP-ribose deacetylase (regulator of RNase III)